jgi:hypothetical protein
MPYPYEPAAQLPANAAAFTVARCAFKIALKSMLVSFNPAMASPLLVTNNHPLSIPGPHLPSSHIVNGLNSPSKNSLLNDVFSAGIANLSANSPDVSAVEKLVPYPLVKVNPDELAVTLHIGSVASPPGAAAIRVPLLLYSARVPLRVLAPTGTTPTQLAGKCPAKASPSFPAAATKMAPCPTAVKIAD